MTFQTPLIRFYISSICPHIVVVASTTESGLCIGCIAAHPSFVFFAIFSLSGHWCDKLIHENWKSWARIHDARRPWMYAYGKLNIWHALDKFESQLSVSDFKSPSQKSFFCHMGGVSILKKNLYIYIYYLRNVVSLNFHTG